MSLAFSIGDVVDWADPNKGIRSGRYTIQGIFGEMIKLVSDKNIKVKCHEDELRHVNKLFAVYHHHEYGSTQWLLKSPTSPTEEQLVKCLGIDFEPEKDEFIAIEEIVKIHTLELS